MTRAFFLDRHSSQIEFYRRVLDEARDSRHPLLERVKFLAIVGTHLEQSPEICRRPDAQRLMREATQYLHGHLSPALCAHGIPLTRESDLARLWDISRIDRPDLRDAPLRPRWPEALTGRTCMFDAIRAGDVLAHHPYESFQPVVDLIGQTSEDPQVRSVSMTLYRTDRDSPIGHALLRAARRGKQVRVFIELNARDDEENNARWAHALRAAGAHVVCGILGLKVHAKLALIVRHERGAIRGYVHISTGNYHAGTSTTYADLGLLTCNPDIAADAAALFGFLMEPAARLEPRRLIVAPTTLRRRLTRLIEREIEWAGRGEPGRLILKMNALTDRSLIRLLYRASDAGVCIDLIVRGACCLRPGVPGLSDRIRVRSIVGRFLEHSRVWYFRNGGQEEAYLASADLRTRNLDRRVEVAVPLTDAALVRRVRDMLALCLADNVHARELRGDGTYERLFPAPASPAISSQAAMTDAHEAGAAA